MPHVSKSPKSKNYRILIVLGVLLLLVVIIRLINPIHFLNFFLPFSTPQISEPNIDLTYSQSTTLNPLKNTTLQVIDYDNVIITLEIPAGSVNESQNIRITPLYHTASSSAFTQGVLVSPSNIIFNKPVTLSFDYSLSKTRSKAPKKINPNIPRFNGDTQLLRFDKLTNSFAPTLISRNSETQTYLPGRIISGGMYIYSLNGGYASFFANQAFKQPVRDVLTTIESATYILSHHQTLSNKAKSEADSAISKILSKQHPYPSEYFAAVALKSLLEGKKNSLISPVYAADVTKGYLEYMCKLRDLNYDQYITEASTAMMLGYKDIADGCMTAAKNIIAEKAREVLINPNVDANEVLKIWKSVQLFGLDELDNALFQKMQEVAVRDAKTVLNNPSATVEDILKALKILQALGVDNPTLESSLTDKLLHANHGSLPPPQSPSPPPANDNEILPNFDMTVVWLMLAKVLGIGPQSFDAPGIHAWVQKMVNNAVMIREVTRALCPLVNQLGGNLPCGQYDSEQTNAIAQMKIEGARAEAQIGGVQAQGYQEENFGSGGWQPSGN